MKKKDIQKRLEQIHFIHFNNKVDYGIETPSFLCKKDRALDRLLHRIEHVCKGNVKFIEGLQKQDTDLVLSETFLGFDGIKKDLTYSEITKYLIIPC